MIKDSLVIEQAQSGSTALLRLGFVRVINALAQHLIATTNTYYRNAGLSLMGNGLCQSLSLQIKQVRNGAFGAGQDNQVWIAQFRSIGYIADRATLLL